MAFVGTAQPASTVNDDDYSRFDAGRIASCPGSSTRPLGGSSPRAASLGRRRAARADGCPAAKPPTALKGSSYPRLSGFAPLPAEASHEARYQGAPKRPSVIGRAQKMAIRPVLLTAAGRGERPTVGRPLPIFLFSATVRRTCRSPAAAARSASLVALRPAKAARNNHLALGQASQLHRCPAAWNRAGAHLASQHRRGYIRAAVKQPQNSSLSRCPSDLNELRP